MNELQIALIGFGALLVAGVWGYNFWQERKYRRHAETMLPANDRAAPDVLMAGREEMPAMPQEPTFSEPTLAEAEDDQHASRQAASLPAEWADGRADCLLRVEFVDAVPAAELWAAHAAWSGQIDKPVQWLGLDANTGRWRALLPQDAGTVGQLAAALQLVDRAGAVNEKTLAVFLDGMHRLAQRFAGLVELPAPAEVLHRARALDDVCAAVDLQLALHVVPRQGSLNEMLGARLRPLLETGRLRLEGERFVAVDEEGAEVFSLVCRAATDFSAARLESMALTDLIFSLDVPRVAGGVAGFERMIACARQAAEALGGQLVDAHGKPIADATLDAIRTRIGELQIRMAQAGIPAGSVRALRLFA